MHICKKPTALVVPEGGLLELDFETRLFDHPAVLFLTEGQCFRKMDEADLRAIELTSSGDPKKYRYLFSHLTDVGHVKAEGGDMPHDTPADFLEYALKSWLQMNPFNSTEAELQVLFDVHDLIEARLTSPESLKEACRSHSDVSRLIRQKIQFTLNQWKSHKLVKRAKYDLFHTGGSVQEAAYNLGFKDPSYFGRFFKRETSRTPGEFMTSLERPAGFDLLHELKDLIRMHVGHSHQVAFYAEKLHLTPKTLSRRVQQDYGLSVKALISQQLLLEAKSMINSGEKIAAVAFRLGFREISHFSSFYKSQTGHTPSGKN